MHGRRPGSVRTYGQELLELLRIAVVAGGSVGILVIGLGSRLAMFVPRVTSPGYVVGMESDDGFEIGRITLLGSYQLLAMGGAVGALVGFMVIVPGGIDFTFLEPTWLAVAFFVGLPVVSGILLTLAVDLVATPESWRGQGRRAGLLPVVLLALVPPAVLVLVPVLSFMALGQDLAEL